MRACHDGGCTLSGCIDKPCAWLYRLANLEGLDFRMNLMKKRVAQVLSMVSAMALAACAEAPVETNIPLVTTSSPSAVSTELPPTLAAVPSISVPAAVAQRSAALATNGKSFDQAFYDASANKNAQNIAELTQAFAALGPEVDPEEARRAATVVYTYVDQLVVEYEIEDRPLVHNTKVNFGNKPRGLCWHWAHDLDTRLKRERFQTLEIHRAIANYNNIRLEHSTTILGRKGDPMAEALVLDPWRKGGELFWRKVKDDTRYQWTPRDEVFAWKRARKARKAN